MRIDQIFNEQIEELKDLPAKPKVFWYPSAGKDFRGNVYLTQHHIDHMARYNGRAFSKPDLFIYNCLGDEVGVLRRKLTNGEVLYSDDNTTVTGLNYLPLGINPEIGLHVDPAHIDLARVKLPQNGAEAFYFEVQISGGQYQEVQKVLYIEHENIDTFNRIILEYDLEVVHLCAIREGMGFDNCRHSIIKHIYEGGTPNFFIDSGFRPRFNFLFTDFTSELFEQSATESPLLDYQMYSDIYISDINDHGDTNIYKIDYLVQ